MFRFACSVMLWGGSIAANKCQLCVGGALAVFWPHWVCPHSQRECFPRIHCSGSWLLSRERALSFMHFPGPSCSGSGSRVLHKGTDSVGPVFCAVSGPRSSGNQELEEHTLFRGIATSPLPVPASVSGRARSDVPCVSSGELISGCNPAGGCQPSRISGNLWLETGSLFAVW